MKNRLKSLSLATLTLLAVASCKNSDVDPANYAGNYEFSGTASYAMFDRTTTDANKGTLIVSVDNGKVKFTEQYPAFQRDYTGTLNGRSVTLAKVSERIQVNGISYNGVMSGSGEFSKDGKTLTLLTSTDVVVSGSPFTKTVKINGTKK